MKNVSAKELEKIIDCFMINYNGYMDHECLVHYYNHKMSGLIKKHGRKTIESVWSAINLNVYSIPAKSVKEKLLFS